MDTIKDVKSCENGIAVLHGKQQTQYHGELFFDCSGFQGLLLQQTLNVPFESFADNLLNDSAIAIPTKRETLSPCKLKQLRFPQVGLGGSL